MTDLNQIYKCNVCGNMVAVVHAGEGQLTCCEKPMELLKENTVDASREKHVPVLERAGGKLTVKVGSAEHPMEEKHFIEWIEIMAGDKTCRQFLKPGDRPRAEFRDDSENVSARGYCNLHGLWLTRE